MGLRRFSSCEISDALLKLGISTGGYLPDILPVSQTKVCGQAYTVQMVLGSNSSAPKLAAHFVDTAPKDSVIVISAPDSAKNAVWGGLMTAGAQARQALGVVISGRCRDTLEHREAGFPVFAKGTSTLGQTPFTRPSEVNVTLRIGEEGSEVLVTPGDWVLGDLDGVVCVPKDLLEAVLQQAQKGRDVDAKCMEDIKKGAGIKETFAKWRGK